jgi:F-type H+-transporting ATPase subunit epsilon
VVSPERVLFEGEAKSVVAPLHDGLAGILPRHAPMLALLGTGPVSVSGPDGLVRFRVAGGFVQVRSDVVRVVAEVAGPL